MPVDANALTSLAAVKEYLSLSESEVQLTGLSIYHDKSGGVNAATVQVTDTALILVRTPGGTNTLTLADADKDTLGELVSAVNALANGWVATLTGPSTRNSDDLVVVPATSAWGSAQELTLFFEGNDLLENLINRISDKVETFCGRKFKSRDYREWRNGSFERTLVLDNPPVTAVKRLAFGEATGLTVRGTTASDLRATVEVQDDRLVLSRFDSAGNETASSVTFASNKTTSALVTAINLISGWSATLGTNWISDDLHRMGGKDAKGVTVSLTFPDQSDTEFRLDEDRGVVEMVRSNWFDVGWDGEGAWPRGFQNILVHYTGGYGTIPDDLEQIAIELVAQAFRGRSRDDSLKSESIGSYSYTLAGQVEIGGDLAARLAMWRHVR